MDIIKKFTDMKKRPLVRNEEVIDEFNIVLNDYTTVDKILKILDKLVNKKVSFHSGSELRFFIDSAFITITNEKTFIVTVKTNQGDFNIDTSNPVRIWAKRTINEIDPYGEEDWET